MVAQIKVFTENIIQEIISTKFDGLYLVCKNQYSSIESFVDFSVSQTNGKRFDAYKTTQNFKVHWIEPHS